MKLIDHAPHVIKELVEAGRPVTQTDLTELVFGSSGRGDTGLTRSLFPYVIKRGWVTTQKKGRSTLFEVTDLGRKMIGTDDPHANWNFETHTFNS